MGSENRSGACSNSRIGRGSYLVVISNLPLKLDIRSYKKYSTISWRPIKDLLRNVINKREDGTDIRPPEGNPGTVHVWPESGGQCGYAMGTLQKRKHAMRALCEQNSLFLPTDVNLKSDWLGGNLWHGRTLSVILHYESCGNLQYIDSCWSRYTSHLVKLEGIVSVSQKELLQRHPSSERPNMLLCLVPKGSMFSTQHLTYPLNFNCDGENRMMGELNVWDKPNSRSQNGWWYPGETYLGKENCGHLLNCLQPTWPGDNFYISGWQSSICTFANGRNSVSSKIWNRKTRKMQYADVPATQTIDNTFLENRTAPLIDRHFQLTQGSSLAGVKSPETCLASSEIPCVDSIISPQLDEHKGPLIADGSKVDPIVDVKIPRLRATLARETS